MSDLDVVKIAVSTSAVTGLVFGFFGALLLIFLVTKMRE
jgi:hypothetical protein